MAVAWIVAFMMHANQRLVGGAVILDTSSAIATGSDHSRTVMLGDAVNDGANQASQLFAGTSADTMNAMLYPSGCDPACKSPKVQCCSFVMNSTYNDTFCVPSDRLCCGNTTCSPYNATTGQTERCCVTYNMITHEPYGACYLESEAKCCPTTGLCKVPCADPTCY